MKGSGAKGRVLIVAGSDSGGGAGIQADIKAVSAAGGYAATAITALTVQNTLGVSAVHPVPLDIIEGQMRAVLDDIGADAIKTGMLATADVVRLVARVLKDTAAGIPLLAIWGPDDPPLAPWQANAYSSGQVMKALDERESSGEKPSS